MSEEAEGLAMRAETRRKKAADQKDQAAAGWAAYKAQAQAEVEKSERLKVLRLAREATEKDEPPAKPKVAKKAAVKVRRPQRRT